MRSPTIVAVLLFWASAAGADGLGDAKAGLAALDTSDYTKAVGLFTRAIAQGDLSPTDKELAYVKRAEAYAAGKDASKAFADLKQALALAPDDNEALFAVMKLSPGNCDTPGLDTLAADRQASIVAFGSYQKCVAESAGQQALDGTLDRVSQDLMFAKINASHHAEEMFEKNN